MKKGILIIIGVLGTIITNAQIDLGIKGGVNYANVVGRDAAGAEAIIGYHAGAVVELGLSERFSLQPELLYSAQGTTFRNNIVGANFDIERTFNYVLLPVLAKVYLVRGLSLEVGPQIGFATSSESRFNGNSLDRNFVETVDFGVAAGAGFKLDNGLFFQGRYNWGLTEIESGIDAKNSVVALSVGYFFLQGSD